MTPELKEEFAVLVETWKRDTAGLSSPRQIINHDAYIEITRMGSVALPLILDDLQRNGGWWYPALRGITGNNPVPESARGNILLIDQAWLEWGRENGHIKDEI